MAKENNFLAILFIVGCIYCLYVSTIILLWCGKMCLRKVNAILPLYTVKHRYVVQMSANTWTALKATTEVWISIQGQNGSSNFYSLPKKVSSEEDPSVQMPKNFIIETSACLKQLLTLTLHVKGKDLQLWDIDKIVVHDTHHKATYTFSLQCTLVVPMCPAVYVVSIEKKAITHVMYAKLAFQFYHNWIAIVTKLTVDTDVSANINLSLILCTLVSSLLSALIVASRENFVSSLDTNEVVHFISFFYLLITNLAIDVIVHWCKRRGPNKMVWGQRPLSYRTMLENKYTGVVAKISLETQDRINSLMSAIYENPMVMVQEGITSHDVDMITAIKVAAIKQRERLISSSTFAEEELAHFTNPEYRDRYVSTTTSLATTITHTDGLLLLGSVVDATRKTSDGDEASAAKDELPMPAHTLASCLFYPFDSRQLFENRVYLWVNFLKKWNNFQESVIKGFLQFPIATDEWQFFVNVSDINLFHQELVMLHRIAQEFQKERVQLRRSSLLLTDIEEHKRIMRTFTTGSMSENRSLFLHLRETALLLVSDLLDAVRFQQLERRFPLSLRYGMEDKLKDLVTALFDEGYLVKLSPRVVVSAANPGDLPTSVHQHFQYYYPPDHSPAPPMSGIGLSDGSKSRSIASFHSDSSSLQMSPRANVKRSLSLPNIKVGGEGSSEDATSVAGVSRDDVLLTWGHWVSSLVDILMNKTMALIQYKVHGMVFSQAIEYIQMQESRCTWKEGCADYIALLSGVVAKTLIESVCVFLGSTNREVILNNLQETLNTDVINAVNHSDSNFVNVLANRYEELVCLVKQSIDRNRELTDDPKWHTSLVREQYRLLYLLNGKIMFDDLKNQPVLSKSMNDVLANCVRQLEHVKRRVVNLREEMENVVFTKQWRSRQEILVKCADIMSLMVQLEKCVGKVELNLDAVYLDVPHAAMDFEYSDINMMRVDQIFSAYFGDMKDTLLPRTPGESSYKQYLVKNAGSRASNEANISGQQRSGTEAREAKSDETTHSGSRRAGVVTPPAGQGILNLVEETNRDLVTFLRSPCRPSLSFFCRQGTLAFLVAEIFFVTVAVIILGTTRDHYVGSVIYIMVGAILCDVFILQPAKCSLFFVTRWLYQNDNVYELYESDSLGRWS